MCKLMENKSYISVNRGEESVKEKECEESKNMKSSTASKTDEFVQFITRVAIAQICETLGFQSFQNSALDTLSDVAVRYIRDIGKIASSSANSANRGECNVFDVIHGIEDLGSGHGVLGCSDVHHCLLGSGMVKEIVRYISDAEEIPFAYAVPEFPVVKYRKLNPSFVQSVENPPGEHIPPWLPVFPDPGTYADEKLKNEKEERKVDKSKQIDEHVKNERSLLSFQHLLGFKRSKMSLGVDPIDERAVKNNLFLTSPLLFGEKEVSLVVPPSKLLGGAVAEYQNLLAEEEAFGPAFGGVTSKETDAEDEGQKDKSEKGSFVQFKLGSGRKISHKAMNFQNESFERITSWFSKDSGKDEKKRMVEKILKEAMGNSEQLDHL